MSGPGIRRGGARTRLAGSRGLRRWSLFRRGRHRCPAAPGQDPQLRAALQARGIGYVLAVACSTRVRINHGRTPVRADTLAGRRVGRHGLAPPKRRKRRERPPVLRLGLDPHRHRQPSAPAPATQPVHRRTRFLPVLVTRRGASVRTGPRRRCPLERRGVLPGRQEPGRTRPLPGPQLDLMAPAHHACHARPGLPDRPRRRRDPRTSRRYAPLRPQPRSDHADRPGNPPPTCRRLQPTSRDSDQAAALVHLAPTPPSNSPTQPLPTPNRQRTRWIDHETHWSTR